MFVTEPILHGGCSGADANGSMGRKRAEFPVWRSWLHWAQALVDWERQHLQILEKLQLGVKIPPRRV